MPPMPNRAPASAALASRRHWLFDMDGTLTRAIHDFDAMRETLGLPPGVPILEALARIEAEDASRARRLRAALDAIELDIAGEARAQPGAVELLESLLARGARLAIVTRNGHGIALATLAACGLERFFSAETIVSRDCAAPKPDPAGVLLALSRWAARGDDAVMVGDFRFDLEAGRRAGTATVHLDVDGAFVWPELTDLAVDSLDALRRHVAPDPQARR